MFIGLLGLVCLVTVGSAYYLAQSAVDLKLVAHPGEHRQHVNPTPMVGGLAMYVGLLFGYILIDQSFALLLPCLFFVCVVGALDDRYALASWLRLVAQALAVYAMIQLTGVRLDSLGYLVSHKEIVLGVWATPITIFAAIGVINAVNMSDGLDGLAGSIVVLCLLALFFLGSNQQSLVLIAMAAVAGFLFWNLRIGRTQAKVYMGDAGSTMLGLLLAYLLITSSQSKEGIWPITALWLIALPLIDAVAVLIVRPIRGKSPFSADRIHYHHQLLDKGYGVNTTLLILVFIQSMFILIGALLQYFRVVDFLQFYAFLLIFTVYVLCLLLKTKTSI